MSDNNPIPLLYSGQAGTYYGTDTEALPKDLHPTVREAGQWLQERGLNYLGRLTCSQFANVQVYAYAQQDGQVAVSLMADESGLAGIDCVSKFADESFLTTTNVQVLANAYDEQKLFRASFPGTGVRELHEEHLAAIGEFERKWGEIKAIFTDLCAVAQMVDEYTLRQQSNSGHGFLQLAGGFAQASVEGMMGDDSDEMEDDEEEEYDEDAIEYDEASVSPLIQAILAEDVAQVESLLAEGTEVNPSDWDENVPLVAAVYRENLEIIQKLIAAEANPDQPDLDVEVNACPVGMAIKQNRADLVRLLLDAGADPNGGDMEETGLAIAVRKDNLPILRMLLEAGADPNADMEDYERVIMEAAWYGRLEMVKLLVEYGAEVSTWSQGETAIMSAARNAHQAVYDYLYPLVDEEIRRYADKHGKEEIERAIRTKARAANKIGEKLGDAAVLGKLNKVKQLLEEGADPNILTEDGKSPLMFAAMYGHKNIIEALLDAGADPNLRGDEQYEEGTTALMEIAASFFANNRAEVIKLLVDRGADVNLQDDERGTALMAALQNPDAVKALIEAGADLNLRDKDGNTAMMLANNNVTVQQLLRRAGASEEGMNDIALVEASREGNLAKVEELLQAGANVNYGDGSALVAAAGKGYLAVVDRAIQAGADVNLGWRTGSTPIASAAYQGYGEVVERLLSAGADPLQRTFDGDGDNALEYAEQGQAEGHHDGQDHAAIIKWLRGLQS
ncbi:ankyrin repeat domain-containing protein [Lusitaniella coriacea]|uniref:ankyrin repeat domain-containing protein n=1 Tax=Lusitaniella coriacea TaxID=1983105 RepID=UPI003CEEF8E5